jgi:hypothetical protein
MYWLAPRGTRGTSCCCLCAGPGRELNDGNEQEGPAANACLSDGADWVCCRGGRSRLSGRPRRGGSLRRANHYGSALGASPFDGCRTLQKHSGFGGPAYAKSGQIPGTRYRRLIEGDPCVTNYRHCFWPRCVGSWLRVGSRAASQPPQAPQSRRQLHANHRTQSRARPSPPRQNRNERPSITR